MSKNERLQIPFDLDESHRERHRHLSFEVKASRVKPDSPLSALFSSHLVIYLLLLVLGSTYKRVKIRNRGTEQTRSPYFSLPGRLDYASSPPSIVSVVPVMYDAAGLARKTM